MPDAIMLLQSISVCNEGIASGEGGSKKCSDRVRYQYAVSSQPKIVSRRYAEDVGA
jgi:hypothetical protein